jgi:uncharacterized protein YycO
MTVVHGLRMALVLAVLGSAGCTGATLVHRDHDTVRAAQMSAAWTAQVLALAADGDGVAIRGYHPTDPLVAVATNASLRHVAILDRDREEIIEAAAPHVRVDTLPRFIANAHRVVLTRPKGWTPQIGKVAVVKAYEKIGVPYDFLGALGSPSKERFYCSELAAWSMGLTVDRWARIGSCSPGRRIASASPSSTLVIHHSEEMAWKSGGGCGTLSRGGDDHG